MKNCARALKKVAMEFCGKTSIHGLKYIIEPGRSYGEKIFWIVMAFISLGIAIELIIVMFSEGYSRATRESIMSHNYPTWLLPFPAITLCNTNRISRSRAMNFIKSLSYPDNIKYEDLVEETKVLLYIMGYNSNVNISNLKSPSDNRKSISLERLFRIQNILDLNNKSYEETMYQLSQPCSELIISCAVKGQFANCLQVFQPSKAFYGFCCSFNYNIPTPDISEHVKHLGHKDPNIVEFFTYGPEWGVSVVLNPGGSSDYFSSAYSSDGINVLIHSSTNYPSELELQSIAQLGGETFLCVSPNSRYVSEDLRSLSPVRRNCFFDDEIQLKYFTNYSFENCLLESKIDYIRTTCRCLPFTYPKIAGVKTCSLKSYKCLKQYFDDWSYWSTDNITVVIEGEIILCLEECNSFTYKISTSVGALDAIEHNSLYVTEAKLSPNFEVNTSRLAVVHTYIGSHESLRLYRQHTFDFDVQITTIGGIFGIAFGCSLISMIEMLYFFTIRFLQYVCKERRLRIKVRPVYVIPYRN